MAIWYKLVDTSDSGIKEFVSMFWGFHDFRIGTVTYAYEKNYLDLFLEYDTEEEGLILRFVGVSDFHINTDRDFEADWIMGGSVTAISEDTLLWTDQEDMDIASIKKYENWVCAGKLFWAVTDGKGNAVELPYNYQHQTLYTLNYQTGKYEISKHDFNPIPCENDEIF